MPLHLARGRPFVVSRAQSAQSHERRFQRALSALLIPWRAIYQHLVLHALREWGDARIILALDTTLLFKRWCVICVSLTSRGRALPLVWRVIRHGSSTVSSAQLHPVLSSVQCLLMHLPHVETVWINVDRGFFDTALMADFTAYGWHWNMRGKAQVYLFDRSGHPLGQFRQQLSQHHGQLVVHHDVYVTAQRYGPVSVAAVLPFGARDPWFIAHDEPCSLHSFAEYHEPTQIEEGFLDLKSGAFQLEDTRLNTVEQLERLLMVMGVAVLLLLSEGVKVVEEDQRRSVDPHWWRGLSYVQLGWRAIQRALTQRNPVLERLCLSSAPDPQPSRRRSCPLYIWLIRGFS